jgi:hypothetical protein
MITEFVVDRIKWLRGEGSLESSLFRPTDGKMCCLGFYGKACGLTEEDMKHLGAPFQVRNIVNNFPEEMMWLVEKLEQRYDSSPDCYCAMSTNDAGILTDDEREEKIKTIFAKHGITVAFIN